MEKAEVKRNVFSAGLTAGVRERIFSGLAARRQVTQVHMWQGCSGTRWNRDEKDRVIVVARPEEAASVNEAARG